jgi:hypothetical protein
LFLDLEVLPRLRAVRNRLFHGSPSDTGRALSMS